MPTRDTPWPDGTPCWVDYGAPDVPAAQAFYGDLFGWEWTGEESPEFGGYVNATLDGHAAAGMGPQQSPDDPPRWTTYFATADAERAGARIRDAGGIVVAGPMDIGPLGRFSIAVDPQGNPFGLWQSGLHTGVRVYDEPGSLTWNEAAVDDPAAARDFYAAVLGFTYDEVPGAQGYATFRSGDRGPEHPLGGLGGLEEGAPRGWQTCFAVASADRAVDTVGAAGGTVLSTPMDTPFGRFAVVQDPWGAPFEVREAPS